jgi:hypothetical protein
MATPKTYNCIIEIDCAPFNGPRPNNVFGVLINSTLQKSDRLDKQMIDILNRWKLESENSSKFMGRFSWRLPYTLTEDQFQILKDELWLEMSSLFTNHLIRYGYIGTDGPPTF